jgi:hypothetical protein
MKRRLNKQIIDFIGLILLVRFHDFICVTFIKRVFYSGRFYYFKKNSHKANYRDSVIKTYKDQNKNSENKLINTNIHKTRLPINYYELIWHPVGLLLLHVLGIKLI